MNRLFAIFILPLSILLVNVSFAGEPDIKLHEKCLYPTIRIESSDDAGFGSGVIIRSEKLENNQYLNIALTCKHVAVNLVAPNVIFTEYINWSQPDEFKKYPAMVYVNHPHYDMSVILFLSYKQLPYADLAVDEKLYVGDELVSFGCALRQPPRMDTGRVSSVLPSGTRADLVSVPGDSGGPVFHNYKLVGLKQAFFGCQFGEEDNVEPIFDFAIQVRVSILKEWSHHVEKAKITLKEETALPELPVLRLQIRQFRNMEYFPLLQLFMR